MKLADIAAEPLLPGWETLLRDFIRPGLPGRVVVRANPKVELVVGEGGSELAAIFAITNASKVPISPFTGILVSEIRLAGVRCLSISTSIRTLFETFYLFALDIARAVVERFVSPIDALQASLEHWRALLQTSTILSPEEQLGLAGELWLLKRLISAYGAVAVEAWVGPGGESHDFRLGKGELEVKSTSGAKRTHMIHGLQQMRPTLGSNLFILSLLFVDAGSGGDTLAESVKNIVLSLSADKSKEFLEKLEIVGYREEDAAHYRSRRRLAASPVLVPVVEGVPRLTPEALANLPSNYAADRISDISYRVDLEGLGYEDGTPEFLMTIPTGSGRV